MGRHHCPPIRAHAEQSMMGLGARVCLDIRVPDQKPKRFRTYHPNAGQASQWGAGVPSLLPRTPKLDILEVKWTQ